MSQLYSFYRADDGTFTGDTYAGQDLDKATPAGCLPVAGRFNPAIHRVDMKTGQVVGWRAPSPTADAFTAWAWDDTQGRWLPGMTRAGLARSVRAERDARLSACDWVVTRATEMGGGIPTEWSTYRAALRALPQQPGFPESIDWPQAPA